MKSTQYSKKVLDHFQNPRNVGTLEGKDVAKGKIGNPVCGDLMEFYIKVKNNIIEDIKFKTFGCGSAIATASMITELAKGKTIEQALKITRKDVADELDGLPPIKMHCSNLAADALKDAIHNYQTKQKPQVEPTKEDKEHRKGIINEEEFLDKGIYYKVDDLLTFKNKRVIVLDKGDKSIETAIELTKQTPRVVYVTAAKEISTNPDLNTKLKQSNVKVLYESEILEVRGMNTVEKVLIHDLNED
ncbi:MAG: Fe-S cluster assembly scaffold protein NifU, partial [Candidatus Stahlbacteria bacterium]